MGGYSDRNRMESSWWAARVKTLPALRPQPKA